MPHIKLDPDALRRYLDAGHSQADAARHFSVSESAISQRVRTLQIATSKVVALERAAEVVDQKLDATARLQHVQEVIDEELRCAVERAKEPVASTRDTHPLRAPRRVSVRALDHRAVLVPPVSPSALRQPVRAAR